MIQHPHVNAVQLDRAAGAALGSAVGDAVGAGYEFGPVPGRGRADMIGGGLGNFAVGEWTDDTSQAIPILQAVAAGHDVGEGVGYDEVAAGWLRWWDSHPADVGVHTSCVLRSLGAQGQTAALTSPADRLASAASDAHARTGHTAGNGALMRTGPLALGYLHDQEGCARAAAAVAALTHADPLAAESCVIWCEAIRVAVLTGTYDGLRGGVGLLPADRRAYWHGILDQAETHAPGTFGNNGFTVVTLQDAWSAIATTDSTDASAFAAAIDAAVNAGNDTDTVAAIAGALAGARWGASAVPARWRRMVHGWPGLTGRDLVSLAVRAARGGQDDSQGWPSGPSLIEYYRENWHVRPAPVPHPDDDGVLLGTSGTLGLLRAGQSLAGRVDVVVSLCRLGQQDIPADVERVDVWLIDSPDPDVNPNLEFVLADTVALVQQMRAQGKRVLLQCVAAESRTPTVAALYGAAITGSTATDALARVQVVLPQADPKAAFQAVLRRGAGSATR